LQVVTFLKVGPISPLGKWETTRVLSVWNDSAMMSNLDYVKEIGLRTQQAFENGRLEEFADLMNEHWVYKRKRSAGISNSQIDEWYEVAIRNGLNSFCLISLGHSRRPFSHPTTARCA
jgi:galactokinase/mevalonate kinase-like predicted kinase